MNSILVKKFLWQKRNCLPVCLAICLSVAIGLPTNSVAASPRKLTSDELYAELQKREGSENLSSSQLRKYAGLAHVLRLTGRKRDIF